MSKRLWERMEIIVLNYLMLSTTSTLLTGGKISRCLYFNQAKDVCNERRRAADRSLNLLPIRASYNKAQMALAASMQFTITMEGGYYIIIFTSDQYEMLVNIGFFDGIGTEPIKNADGSYTLRMSQAESKKFQANQLKVN